MANYIVEYYNKIKSGEITVGVWVIIIYTYITRGIASNAFCFDSGKADRAITFIETFCHHCEGRSDLLKLELWQKAAVSVIFGIVESDTGLRVFREIVIIVARKNGKSLFADAIIAYAAYADGEYGAKIYCLAPKLEQAAIVYDNFYQMVTNDEDLLSITKKRRSDIYIPEVNTLIKPLAFNAKKSDGFNPHLTVCDEIASWEGERGKKQYEVMKSALGARSQPLLLSISTAGYINDGIYDELITRCTKFLNAVKGKKTIKRTEKAEWRLLPLLYIIDDTEKWDDIKELKKSNPNLGVSVSEDYLREEIKIAKLSYSKKSEFMCKYCNIKQNSTSAWLDFEVVDKISHKHFTLADFAHSYCVGGIDLSQTTDLTCCSIVIERQGVLYVFAMFFMPRNKVEELTARDGLPYMEYVHKGWLTLSGDNYVDYHDCYDWFVSLVKEYEVLPLQIGYDRYSAQYLINDLSATGFHMDDVYQGENLTPVITEFDGLIRDKKIYIGNNMLLKAHFLNVALKSNAETRKCRPVKIEPTAHIDGFVSVIDALTVRQKWAPQIGEQLKNE